MPLINGNLLVCHILNEKNDIRLNRRILRYELEFSYA